ncbi:PREDICTED: uncharacterized protein LOC108557928 [Nicrophorus vespilloides]|uniref:Uncharacterized protein LOC108557928 n=1 Tax=Nicrophorus vespilloides TaxID=110193 RepID=A0ABM1M6F9_NICVS|nr:PREDICTED: uncharacterized protein LOC108557928 [Nicrophorus vespilloides]
MEQKQTSQQTVQNESLRIDNVLTTQPELGPSVPDGGYGWIILLAVSFFKVSLPSIKIAYGLFLMYSTLETTNNINLGLFDNDLILTPIIFFVASTILDPISRKMITNSKWPRLFALSGVCLTCAGILFLWIALDHHGHLARFLYVLSGLSSGCGVALVETQCEVLLAQYFRLKLNSINVVLQIMTCIGYIFTPISLGHYINMYGIVHVIIWYHLYILIGVGVCTLFKKPDYLKGKLTYNSVKVGLVLDEEEDIYSAKKSTELKEARIVEPNAENNEPIAGTSSSDMVEVDVHNANSNWEKFSDDENDDEHFHEFKNNMAAPKELFTDLHLNNNTTYSFDNSDILSANDDTNIFMPNTKSVSQSYSFFKEGSFYKSVLLQTTLTYSKFIFYTLYPSTLYFNISLHIEDINAVLCYLFIISSIIVLASKIFLVNINNKNCAIFVVIVSWIGTIGYYMISDIPFENVKVFGGGLSLISISVLQYLTEGLITPNVKSEPNRVFIFLNLLSALCFVLLSVRNITYTNCFRLMGLLQFANGSVWFCNFIYKKIIRVD